MEEQSQQNTQNQQPNQAPQPPVVPTPVQQPPHQENKSHNKLMAVLAYLGILIVIPFLVSPQDKYVKFHLKQGAVLLITWIIIWALTFIEIPFNFLTPLLSLGAFVLTIMGIINALTDKEKELPLIGHLGNKINF
ncbi:MAG: hypothetical protein Q8P83_04170 [bacterium]|nr:hypothetical protein [bacterium]